jgi:glutaredoxin
MKNASSLRKTLPPKFNAMCTPPLDSFNSWSAAVMPEPIRIDIYSRPGCHLCDDAKAVIEQFRSEYPMNLKTINVEDKPEYENRYGNDIPVVMINGHEAFRHRVERTELERKLKAEWNR